MTTPNKSEKLYSSSAVEFIKAAFKEDYYLGFGVGKAGYEKYTNRLSKVAANNSIFGKRILPNNITAVIDRKDWEPKSYIPYNPAVEITNSICFNSTNGGLYLCVKDPTFNTQSKFGSERSRYKPDSAAGVIDTKPDGYAWILIAKDSSAYLTDYVRIRGIDTMVEFKGITADSSSPTGATGGGGSTGLSTGTCCLYAKAPIEINGVCLDKGDIVQAFTVPNEVTCRIFGNLLDLQPVFKDSLLGVCGGFFNYSGTAGCTPCAETLSSVTPFEVFGDVVALYPSTDIYRVNYETQSTNFKSGGLVNAAWWDDPTKTYYVSKDRPELVLSYDGTIGNFKAYLKTEYVGSNLGYKVIGVVTENELDVENCVYVEAVNIETGVVGSSLNGDFSECLANIEFGLLPESDDDYLNIYGLLRPSKIAVELSITKTEMGQLTPTTLNPQFVLDSVFISKGMRYPDGRKVSTVLNRGYTPSLKRTCAVTTIPSVSGLSEASFIYEPVTSSTNYFSNKLNRTKTSRFSGDSVEPANPLSSYKLTNVSGSDILITSYDSSTSLTGGITLGYANPDKTSGSLYLSTLDKAPFKFDGCEIFFASDSTIDTAASTYKVTSIFDIS
jgi:hypothetical protein